MEESGRRPLRRRGFTLVELLVCVALLGLLGAMAFASWRETVRKARRVEARTALLELMQQEERYYSQNLRYVAFSASAQDQEERKFRWYSGQDPASSHYELSGAACPGATLGECVVLSARPGTPRVGMRHADPACGTLTLASTGLRDAEGDAEACWR